MGCSKGVGARGLVGMGRWLAEVPENFQRTLAFKKYQRILVKSHLFGFQVTKSLNISNAVRKQLLPR